jgi:inorganic pyrophosphatase
MDLSKLTAGRDPPFDINVLIEIPVGGPPVKYELDKESGALIVDRFLNTAMFYPGNYGFIPQTLSQDGDPCDALVVASVGLIPGSVIRCRPVGVLVMEDQAGPDEKIIGVPVEALHPFYAGVRSHEELPAVLHRQIAHFFQHYKDLDPDKWTRIERWGDAAEAERLILEGIARASRAGAA